MAFERFANDGKTGDTGATGPTGPQGIPGTSGENGLNGADGQDGEPGPNEISTATATTFDGLILGDGANCQTSPISADAKTFVAAADNAAMRESLGVGATDQPAFDAVALNGSDPKVTLLTRVAAPSTPSAGNVAIYVQKQCERFFARMKSSDGLDHILQPGLFSSSSGLICPGTGASPTQFGTLSTTVGTVAHPTQNTTNFRTVSRRMTITSSASANSASEMRHATSIFWRGNSVGQGGFFFSARFSHSSAVANQRVAVGLWNATGATSTSQSPSSLTDAIFFGWDSADTNLQVMHNDASGACTKVDLGSGFPANNTTAVYEVQLFAIPNDSAVYYQVTRMDQIPPTTTSGTITTNLPSATLFLTWHVYMNNGGTAQAVVLELMRLYIEADY